MLKLVFIVQLEVTGTQGNLLLSILKVSKKYNNGILQLLYMICRFIQRAKLYQCDATPVHATNIYILFFYIYFESKGF